MTSHWRQGERGQSNASRVPDDGVREYFKILEQYPPFTPQEELTAARRLAAARKRVAYVAVQCPGALGALIQLLKRQSARRRQRQRPTEALHDFEVFSTQFQQLVDYHRQFIQVSSIPDNRDTRVACVKDRLRRIQPLLRQAARLTANMDIRAEDLRRLSAFVLSEEATSDTDGLRTAAVTTPQDDPAVAPLRPRTVRTGPVSRGGQPTAALRISLAEYEACKHSFCKHNLRLVVAVAKRFRNSGIPFLDLIQEGNTGLVHAVDRFDHRRGCRFSTYAVWWIRRYISQAVTRQSRVMVVSERVSRRIAQIAELSRQYLHASGQEPGAADLADELGTSPDDVMRILRLVRQTASLDAPSREGGVEVKDDRSPIDVAALSGEERLTLQRRLAAALDTLNYCEREIVKLRYGVADDSRYTLEEVGSIFCLSGERVRQIENRALQKLRKCDLCVGLTDFLLE